MHGSIGIILIDVVMKIKPQRNNSGQRYLHNTRAKVGRCLKMVVMTQIPKTGEFAPFVVNIDVLFAITFGGSWNCKLKASNEANVLITAEIDLKSLARWDLNQNMFKMVILFL